MHVHVLFKITSIHISPAVSEVALGLGGRAVLTVTGVMVPEGTASVVSVGTCTQNMKCRNE